MVSVKIFMNYIRNSSKRFSVYIINRLHQGNLNIIYKINIVYSSFLVYAKLNSNINVWYLIPGKNNTVDQCTRYNPVTSLTFSSLWIKGPHFLYENEPVSFESKVPSRGSKSTDLNICMIFHCKPVYRSFIKWENYLSFSKLVKHSVCILKLKHHWMNKIEKLLEIVDFKEMTVKEFYYAEDQIFLENQRDSYLKENNALTSKKYQS